MTRYLYKGMHLQQFKEPALSRDLHEFLSADSISARMKRECVENPEELTPEQIIEIAREAKIIDERDGVPLADKLENAGTVKTLVADAIDDEPYISSQINPLIKNQELAQQGMSFAIKAIGAQNGCFAVYKNITDLNVRIPSRVGRFRVERIRGRYPLESQANQSYSFRDDVYVVGVCALLHLARAILYNKPQNTTFITVAGDCIANSTNLEISLGMTVAQALERCGLLDDPTRVIIGGSMTGISLIDTEKTLITPVTRAILAFREPEDHKHYQCIGCGRCVQACPVGLNPFFIYRSIQQQNYQVFKDLDARMCVNCNLCSYACPAKLNLSQTINEGMEQMRPMVGAIRQATALKRQAETSALNTFLAQCMRERRIREGERAAAAEKRRKLREEAAAIRKKAAEEREREAAEKQAKIDKKIAERVARKRAAELEDLDGPTDAQKATMNILGQNLAQAKAAGEQLDLELEAAQAAGEQPEPETDTATSVETVQTKEADQPAQEVKTDQAKAQEKIKSKKKRSGKKKAAQAAAQALDQNVQSAQPPTEADAAEEKADASIEERSETDAQETELVLVADEQEAASSALEEGSPQAADKDTAESAEEAKPEPAQDEDAPVLEEQQASAEETSDTIEPQADTANVDITETPKPAAPQDQPQPEANAALTDQAEEPPNQPSEIGDNDAQKAAEALIFQQAEHAAQMAMRSQLQTDKQRQSAELIEDDAAPEQVEQEPAVQAADVFEFPRHAAQTQTAVHRTVSVGAVTNAPMKDEESHTAQSKLSPQEESPPQPEAAELTWTDGEEEKEAEPSVSAKDEESHAAQSEAAAQEESSQPPEEAGLTQTAGEEEKEAEPSASAKDEESHTVQSEDSQEESLQPDTAGLTRTAGKDEKEAESSVSAKDEESHTVQSEASPQEESPQQPKAAEPSMTAEEALEKAEAKPSAPVKSFKALVESTARNKQKREGDSKSKKTAATRDPDRVSKLR